LLDDIAVSKEDKYIFLEHFGIWLNGGICSPNGQRESDILKLIQLIENQYNWFKFPYVYESLLSIYEAQCDSLKQQNMEIGTGELVDLTFKKGATSVIADGYLINGSITPSLFTFLCWYGVLLQLCDDLQDLESDLYESHFTLYNTATPSKLVQYTDYLIGLSDETLKT